MQETSSALIDQLVYFDNFLLNNSETPNLDMDGQLSLDLAAFADDSFIFADEDKPDPHSLSDFEDGNGEGSSRREYNNGERSERSQIPDGDFKNVDASKEAAQNGNFALDFQDESSSALPLDHEWYNTAKERTADRMGRRGSEGNQLHSLLNSKIEATKRNKFSNHVGHPNADTGNARNSTEQFAARNPSDIFEEASGEGAEHLSQNNHQSFSQNQHYPENNPGTKNNQNNQNGRFESDRPEAPQNTSDKGIPDLSNLPKYPVPPGAKSSLKKAGLSQNQIDLLSALIAQHQTSLKNDIDLTRGSASSTPVPRVPTLVSHSSTTSIHSDYAKENSRYSVSGPSRFEPKTVTSSIIESPASNYSSEYSNGSTMSVTHSPYRENVTQSNIDENGNDVTKRKRNTAASARFRIKKKMKEKEMEVKISQLGEMIQKFEMRIDELEMENKFLKNLVIEKGDRASDEELRLLKSKANYVDLTDTKGS